MVLSLISTTSLGASILIPTDFVSPVVIPTAISFFKIIPLDPAGVNVPVEVNEIPVNVSGALSAAEGPPGQRGSLSNTILLESNI